MLYFTLVGDIYFRQIDHLLSASKNSEQLFEAIVNAPFHNKIKATQMDLGIVVLLLVDKAKGTIDRIALSDTEQAAGAVKMSEKPFREIVIPLHYQGNAIAEAIDSGEPQSVTDWKHLFIPALEPSAARFNQAGAGIEFSCVYPLQARDGGALIFSFYQVGANIGPKQRSFMRKYSDLASRYLREASGGD
ncbi:MAG TPA: hypothetical protein VL737_04240 [Candidatus Pristimantibacillus sp.]|nr:hypothetical protein [Candidatus Pristimantibacillus sp.]